MSTEAVLALERQRLVLTTVADAVSATVSSRRAPSVAFEEDSTTATRGCYEGGRRNRVHVRVRGFLDEPTVTDDTIRAAVLHEIGHWADRWGRVGDYGIAVGVGMIYLGIAGLVVGVGALLVGVATFVVEFIVSASGVFRGYELMSVGVKALVAGLAIGVLGVLLVRAWSWPAEYRADAFAARRVGVPAVRAMVAAGRRTRIPITHPSLGRRTTRLTHTVAT